MPRSRTKSWRAFDPEAHAANLAATRAAGGAAVTGAPVSARAADAAAVRRRATAQPTVRITPAVKVRILGIDPGSRRMGFGVIECKGSNSTQLTHGCVNTGTGSLSERLRLIFEGVNELIEQYSPDEVAIERVFLKRNVDSALKLGQARGAALCAVPRTVPVFEYAPRAIKLAVVGFGAAEKEQVAHMIRTLLGVQGRIQADASDALAIALCHAHSRRDAAAERGSMIGSLRGRIASKLPPQVTVEVGGVGYELEAPMSTFLHLPAIGEDVKLLTHFVVREDAQLLYGFATEDERRLFRSLLKVSGVSPKIGLALLSGISVEGFAACVRNQDVAALIRVPGVGRKTAERLIVEMRDRLAPTTGGAVGAVATQPAGESGGRSVRCAGGAGLQPGRSHALAQGRRSRYTLHRRADPPGAAERGPVLNVLSGKPFGSRTHRHHGRESRRRGHRPGHSSAHARRLRRPAGGEDAARDFHRRRATARGSTRSRADLRASRPRQDDARAHHRGRARR